MRKLHIIAGEGPFFGSGHLLRMRELNERLSEGKWETHFSIVRSEQDVEKISGDLNDKEILWILDARDADPRYLTRTGIVIAVDNRHISRQDADFSDSIFYYDTLPYPGLPLEEILLKILISRDLPRTQNQRKSSSIFVYSGLFEKTQALDIFLCGLVKNGNLSYAVRCGAAPVAASARKYVEHYFQLGRSEYLIRMSDSQYVMSYFGMTLFEGWCCGSIPVLFSNHSSVHDALMRYISNEAGIPFADDRDSDNSYSHLGDKFIQNNIHCPAAGPGRDGYEKLISFLMEKI